MKKKISFICPLAALIAVVAFALTACGGDNDKFMVYFGLNDAVTGSQKVETAEAQSVIRKIITDKGVGYTEYVAYGAYNEDDKVVENATLVYAIVFVDKDTVLEIIAEAKTRLNLASVMIETYRVGLEFAE